MKHSLLNLIAFLLAWTASGNTGGDTLAIDIEGVWILDSAIIVQTSDDGAPADTCIYLLGDTVMMLDNGHEHPQPPQKVIFAGGIATFEYSSPVDCRLFVEYCRTGQYGLRRTPEGYQLRICFKFSEEFICVRDERHLKLLYTTYLSDLFGTRTYRENGVFKFKPTKQ